MLAPMSCVYFIELVALSILPVFISSNYCDIKMANMFLLEVT